MSVFRTIRATLRRVGRAAPIEDEIATEGRTAVVDKAASSTGAGSYEELVAQILSKFPDRLSRGRTGRIAGRPIDRPVSRALAERLLEAGVDPAVQGDGLGLRELMVRAAELPKEQVAALGLDLPHPPRHLKYDRLASRTGFDLVAADAVVWLMQDAGIELARGGRYLYLDSDCGHGVRALLLGLPTSQWVGLASCAESVAWAAEHIRGADFAGKPAKPPVAQPDDSFEGVVALGLAEAGPDEMRLWLADLWRLVRPGGFLVTAAPGYAVLATLAVAKALPIDDLIAACRELDEKGTARLKASAGTMSLFAEPWFTANILADHWQSHRPIIGRGPGKADLYFAQRRQIPLGSAANVVSGGREHSRAAATIDDIEVCDAAQLLSGAVQGSLIGSVPIAAAGSVRRRPPAFVDSSAVPSALRGHLDHGFAQRRAVYPPLHLLSLAEALLVGQGSVVVQAGDRYRLLYDSAREFLKHRKVPDGFERGLGERFAIARPISRRILPCCLLLQRPWSKNFGHWLIDQAMALSYLIHTKALPTRHIVVAKIHQKKLREIMQQTLAAILPEAVVHEHPDTEVWQFRELAYVMPLHVPGSFKLPGALDCLRGDLLAVPTPNLARPRRLHILRNKEASRGLVNESEIIALSTRYGFSTVIPENHSMAEQAALFNGAEAVLGVKGAAMTNILFADASCRLMVMSPSDFIDRFFWDIASMRDIAYSEVYGATTTDDRPAGRNNFHVDPARVEVMIRRALTSQPQKMVPD